MSRKKEAANIARTILKALQEAGIRIDSNHCLGVAIAAVQIAGPDEEQPKKAWETRGRIQKLRLSHEEGTYEFTDYLGCVLLEIKPRVGVILERLEMPSKAVVTIREDA